MDIAWPLHFAEGIGSIKLGVNVAEFINSSISENWPRIKVNVIAPAPQDMFHDGISVDLIDFGIMCYFHPKSQKTVLIDCYDLTKMRYNLKGYSFGKTIIDDVSNEMLNGNEQLPDQIGTERLPHRLPSLLTIQKALGPSFPGKHITTARGTNNLCVADSEFYLLPSNGIAFSFCLNQGNIPKRDVGNTADGAHKVVNKVQGDAINGEMGCGSGEREKSVYTLARIYIHPLDLNIEHPGAYFHLHGHFSSNPGNACTKASQLPPLLGDDDDDGSANGISMSHINNEGENPVNMLYCRKNVVLVNLVCRDTAAPIDGRSLTSTDRASTANSARMRSSIPHLCSSCRFPDHDPVSTLSHILLPKNDLLSSLASSSSNNQMDVKVCSKCGGSNMHSKLMLGMTPQDIISLLGSPDFIGHVDRNLDSSKQNHGGSGGFQPTSTTPAAAASSLSSDATTLGAGGSVQGALTCYYWKYYYLGMELYFSYNHSHSHSHTPHSGKASNNHDQGTNNPNNCHRLFRIVCKNNLPLHYDFCLYHRCPFYVISSAQNLLSSVIPANGNMKTPKLSNPSTLLPTTSVAQAVTTDTDSLVNAVAHANRCDLDAFDNKPKDDNSCSSSSSSSSAGTGTGTGSSFSADEGDASLKQISLGPHVNNESIIPSITGVVPSPAEAFVIPAAAVPDTSNHNPIVSVGKASKKKKGENKNAAKKSSMIKPAIAPSTITTSATTTTTTGDSNPVPVTSTLNTAPIVFQFASDVSPDDHHVGTSVAPIGGGTAVEEQVQQHSGAQNKTHEHISDYATSQTKPKTSPLDNGGNDQHGGNYLAFHDGWDTWCCTLKSWFNRESHARQRQQSHNNPGIIHNEAAIQLAPELSPYLSTKLYAYPEVGCCCYCMMRLLLLLLFLLCGIRMCDSQSYEGTRIRPQITDLSVCVYVHIVNYVDKYYYRGVRVAQYCA